MHISYISLNRILEKRATEDEELGELIKHNGKCTLSDGRALSDESLLEKLHSLGIREASQSWLDEVSQAFPSAQALSKAITERDGVDIPDDQVDWVWISLVCLWERWFPDRSNFEMLDDRVQEGYDAYERKEPLETARVWLQAWHDVENLMQTFEIESIDEFDILFGGSQSVFNWVQDFSDALHWATRTEPSLAREQIGVCRTVLRIAESNESDGTLIDGFRRDLAESLADAGEISTAEQLYREWISEDPCWGWGWIGWADIYHLFPHNGNQDVAKAEQILKDGLAVPDVEDRKHIVERLAILYEETGRGQAAADLRQGAKRTSTGTGDKATNLDDIIAELDAEYTGKLPENALRAAQARSDEITPRLIQLIEEATDVLLDGDFPDSNGHLFALFLLTEFRAKEALPAILKAVSLPGEGPFELFGDAITEDLSRMLAELATPEVIDELIENQSLNEYVRWEAAQTYLHWVRDGRLSREQAIQRLSDHLKLAIENKDVEITECLISELTNYSPREALDVIEQAYERGLVDEVMIDLTDIRRSISEGESCFQRALKHCRPTGVEDTVEELRTWAAFRDDQHINSRGTTMAVNPTMTTASERQTQPMDWEPVATIRNTAPKVGRNAPCPCGSGKKYKKCCGTR